ncbi:rhomboid family intramembrane serine protease [Pelagicoccus sp. SDUM812002]|uniref:rhomboid family intramembrane serine protease n=1 Tax=Pelagicoccus sp. SDUM812002 TaxID=3041266 RepID=UPI00280F37DB|nr:rhomboid family intramembrane serine protease [Pelagicoccus sp. SDUM812002]MDQ8184985.1 rhomboid family intramembrane serine protease [Pelagicoccus sp. SDUM812002]
MTFNATRSTQTHQPLFYLGKIPMDATNTLVALHALTALVVTFGSGWAAATWFNELVYSATALKEFRIWTLLSYPFVHAIDIWFAVGLYFFWRFGGEVENLLGTRKFIWFYAALTALPALGLFVLSPFIGDLPLVGEGSVHFAIFVGFALMYPSAAMWFNIQVKWFVLFIVGVQTLQYLGYKSWGSLAALWFSILAAFTILHIEGVRSCHFMTGWIQAKLNIKIVTKSKSSPKKQNTVQSITRTKEIDVILDKISETGFQSLTPEEKAILDESSSRYSNRKKP